MDGDKLTCCKPRGAAPTIVVKVTASLALQGVSKAEMETDQAKKDFANSVASRLDGVKPGDIKNIVVTELFTSRRRLGDGEESQNHYGSDANQAWALFSQAWHRLGKLFNQDPSRRLQAATGVEVTFDM